MKSTDFLEHMVGMLFWVVSWALDRRTGRAGGGSRAIMQRGGDTVP